MLRSIFKHLTENLVLTRQESNPKGHILANEAVALHMTGKIQDNKKSKP